MGNIKTFEEFAAGPLNEATHVGKKHDLIIGDMRELLRGLVENITESPDYGPTARASNAAVARIEAAFERFVAEAKSALGEVGTNYAGT